MQWVWGAVEEMLPVVAFFFVYQYRDFETAIVVMVVLTFMLVGLSSYFGRSLPQFAIWSTVGLAVFAVIGFVTGDASVFILSDTIINGVVAIILLATAEREQPVIKILFERVFAISDKAWRTLSVRWGVFLLLLAFGNEVIRLGYSTEVWAWYKLIGTFAVLIFGCYQFTLSIRERIVEESNWLGLRTK